MKAIEIRKWVNMGDVLVSTQVEKDFKDILFKLLNGRVDQFEVLDIARKFSIRLSQDLSFSQQTFVVQKFVLQQLTKAESDENEYYSRLLIETESHLSIKCPSSYSCCLVGCLFSTELHRNYLKHLKTVHLNYDRLVCNFKKKL